MDPNAVLTVSTGGADQERSQLRLEQKRAENERLKAQLEEMKRLMASIASVSKTPAAPPPSMPAMALPPVQPGPAEAKREEEEEEKEQEEGLRREAEERERKEEQERKAAEQRRQQQEEREKKRREHEALKRQVEALRKQLELKSAAAASRFPWVGPGVTIEAELSRTNSATVYRGTLEGRTAVAIKLLHIDYDVENTLAHLRQQYSRLRELPAHGNVGRVLGWYDQPPPGSVMSEFVGAGEALNDHLLKHGPPAVEEVKRLALGIARGLAFLHSHGVHHGNLKSPNVLLSAEKEPVLVDYGAPRPMLGMQNIARDRKRHGASRWSWLAPELMVAGSSSASAESDVYALGIILWELLSGKIPFAGMGFKSEAQVFMHISSGKRLPVENGWDRSLSGLMARCWQHEPDQRPSVGEIIRLLDPTASAREKPPPKKEAQGPTDALEQWRLGLAYSRGIGVALDLRRALHWFRKAATQGYARAQFKLGLSYDEQVATELGAIVQKDAAVAVEWYAKAAQLGHVAAQYNLAVAYDQGHGVPSDLAKAVNWYQRAAEQGDVDALYNLAALYDEGCGVDRDLARAAQLYAQAANAGDAEAQFALGTLYADGEGMERDEALAIEWFGKAAQQGHAEAQAVVAGGWPSS